MYRPPRAGRILARRVAVVAPSDRNGQSKEDIMAASQTPAGEPIKVGVITDQTGPLS